MGFLRSRRWRIFLIVWMVYSLHFATNVVREHYPAFSLVDHFSLFVDEYQGFHSDIFQHRNGHSVVGNQVLVSVLAAIPLLIFDPVLDALEDYSKAEIARRGVTDTEYRVDKKPNAVRFFRLTRERGLDLRFGAATFVTTAFFMAPLTALFAVFFYGVLVQRGVSRAHATGLTLMLAFGTPIFFRSTGLNHNMFLVYAMFAAFVLLWVRPGMSFPVSRTHRLLAGFCGGVTLATDYIGVVILPLLYAYLVIPRLATASWKTSLRESLDMVAGSLPPIVFLLFTQWLMYGNPFMPGQYWMPNQNAYVQEGARGFTLPDGALFLHNLFHPAFGLYTWGPLLALALVPAWWYPRDSLILPRRERRFVVAAFAIFLLFCASNQYSRLQWNSGFRYLIPLVPFFVLAIADHWVRLPRSARIVIAALAVLHSWVLTAFREPVPQSWKLFLSEGIQLPWFRVLRLTAGPESPLMDAGWVPGALVLMTVVVAVAIWHHGAKLERRSEATG
jgi:hypothetical protein